MVCHKKTFSYLRKHFLQISAHPEYEIDAKSSVDYPDPVRVVDQLTANMNNISMTDSKNEQKLELNSKTEVDEATTSGGGSKGSLYF
jgi:hypothetical protein